MAENIQKTFMVDVVEETFDVHREEQRNFLLACGLDVVCEGESGVKAGGVRSSSKLVERHELVFA